MGFFCIKYFGIALKADVSMIKITICDIVVKYYSLRLTLLQLVGIF